MPNEKGTAVYTLQKKFQSIFGFTLPLFHGRGLLNCELLGFREVVFCSDDAGFLIDNVGLMPYRRRIVAVSKLNWLASFCEHCSHDVICLVGKPIRVKQHDKPTLDEVREVQERYIEELTR